MGTSVRSAFQHKSLASVPVNKKALFVAARFIIDNQTNPVKESEGLVLVILSTSKKELFPSQKVLKTEIEIPDPG